MSTRLPTNIVFSCAKQGLTGIKALITPASPELTAIQGAQVGKLFDITFQLLAPTLANGDLLTNEADPTDKLPATGRGALYYPASGAYPRPGGEGSGMITYAVTIPQLPALRAAFAKAPELTKAAIATAANTSLVAYQGTARQLAPVDSGHLRGSIQITPFTWTGNSGQGSVGPSNTKYAAWMEEGTGIYGPAHTLVVPKTKPMLAWYSGGKWHFASSVRGSKPRWYMKGSYEANQSRTESNFQMASDSVADAIAGG